MIPRTRNGRVLVGLLAAAIVLAAGLAVFALSARNPSDVSNSDVAFQAENTNQPAAKAATAAFEWPVYGYDSARTHNFPVKKPFRPPFKVRWSLRGNVLLEFGPVAGDKSLYLLRNNAALYAMKRTTGTVYWKKKLGELAASSP
ncbi:MAG: hypothetical protein F2813_08660, partial [Actinobacteria bacterium]|nr:hypothetical protein [Actinomycetota bacterium]